MMAMILNLGLISLVNTHALPLKANRFETLVYILSHELRPAPTRPSQSFAHKQHCQSLERNILPSARFVIYLFVYV